MKLGFIWIPEKKKIKLPKEINNNNYYLNLNLNKKKRGKI